MKPSPPPKDSPEETLKTWISHPTQARSLDTVMESQNSPEELPLDQDLEDPKQEKEETLEDRENKESQIQPSPEEYQASLEALLFVSEKPLSLQKLQGIFGLEKGSEIDLESLLLRIQEEYRQPHHGFELLEIAGGFQFRTKPSKAHLLQKLVSVKHHRLSAGCMETLAIIAYQQPALKDTIDQVRGVDSSHFIRILLEKKLIQMSGRSELPGKPILYSTTPEFLEVFGLKNREALPPLRELEQMIPQSEISRLSESPQERNMRQLVHEMKVNPSEGLLAYSPEEDEKILSAFREKIRAIPSSTPFLDALQAAEAAEAESFATKTLESAPSSTPPEGNALPPS